MHKAFRFTLALTAACVSVTAAYGQAYPAENDTDGHRLSARRRHRHRRPHRGA